MKLPNYGLATYKIRKKSESFFNFLWIHKVATQNLNKSESFIRFYMDKMIILNRSHKIWEKI